MVQTKGPLLTSATVAYIIQVYPLNHPPSFPPSFPPTIQPLATIHLQALVNLPSSHVASMAYLPLAAAHYT